MNLMFLVQRTSGGGAEKVITALASQLAEEHTVWLVTTVREDGTQSYPISEKVRYLNLYDLAEENGSAVPADPRTGARKKPAGKVLGRLIRKISVFLPTPAKTGGEENRFRFQIDRTRELKQKLKIDCAVSFLNSTNYINAMSQAGERCIISVRSYPEGPFAPADCRLSEGRRRIEEACAAADVVVPVSREAGLSLVRSFGVPEEKIRVICNAVDGEQIRRQSREAVPEGAPVFGPEEFVFYSTGRLTQKKGQWHLLRAFSEVVRRHPQARLVLLGREGKGRENAAPLLRKLIRAFGLTDKVVLGGFYANPYPLLARGGAYVTASFNEGFPNALTEAMALGLPAVAADCRSGPREILAPETDCTQKTEEVQYASYGILVPECSGRSLLQEPPEPAERELAAAMCRLIEDPALRQHYSEKSIEGASRFPRDGILTQWKAILEHDG